MDVVMPQLGETVAEGKIASWFKNLGDTVAEGETLFEIETDKVTMEVQALGAGVLSDIRVAAGETVPVGTVVCVIGGDVVAPKPKAEPAPAAAKSNGAAPPATPMPVAPAADPIKTAPMDVFNEVRTPTTGFGPAAATANGVRMTPLARRLAAQQGLDAATLSAAAKAAGRDRIGKADVLAAAAKAPTAAPVSAPAPSAAPAAARAPEPAKPGTRTTFNTVRKMTGTRLTQSWTTIPHVFQATEADFSNVDKVRNARKGAFKERHGLSLTYLPFIARAVCIAIADFPLVNARFDGDGLEVPNEINLGIAVDLSHNGLVVPVVKNADELTVVGLVKAFARQIDKAKAGKLTPDDYNGGTYTISNNGSFGTLFTAPIINPPQVAILSTDAVKKKPVAIEVDGSDVVVVRPVGMLAQSFDHRAFDGAYSAAFLAKLKQVIETRDWASELA
ncbi:dihydrolipoamide acetyltransferase family protein [Pseudoxanthobacter sp. M-2]|uniref:dihydrolipoamide acetyltransferase family protein n=1 Tax=Pseudoxanthobacter sp. M-2 TaxID=3078754 RepID=UPI0038FC6DE2